MELIYMKKFLDACHQAKRITELMPKLPERMTPRHIHVIDALFQLEQKEDSVKVSDVSGFLGVTRPSITKLLNELESLGAVEKIPDEADRRVTLIRLTEKGKKYYNFYVEEYQGWLLKQLGEADTEEFMTTVNTIARVYKIVSDQKTAPVFPGEE
ncbi:MarR family transcriptional regulator [Ruminococcus sp. CLA-AA-H200]|uniref:MarR family transcriptional regulator n=1 Tax=Ruminococcus turbiniformis TaxID=2881258 RepID=A0ABS8FY58_9FIRM|nr:MarR family transcriptional regulator [Ruminococcus turbiniformis]MCC2254995.1 MarR family transcriptional regulator [Ruminococcus turbiniformis]